MRSSSLHRFAIPLLVLGWLTLVVAHGRLVLDFVLFEQLFDAQPFQRIDYPLHYHNALDGAVAMEQFGSYWSYNPAFAAGFPQGMFDDPGNHASAIAVWLLWPLQPVVAFKLWVVATFLAVPLLLGAVGALAGLDRWSLVLAALGTALWQVDPMFFLFRWFGSFNFVNGCVMSLVCMAAVSCYLGCGGAVRLLMVVVAAPLTLLAHPLNASLVVAPGLVLVLFAARAREWWRVAGVAVAGAVALLVNLWWIVPVWRFLDIKRSFGFIAVETGRAIVDELWLGEGVGVRALVLALAVAGIACSPRTPFLLACAVATVVNLGMFVVGPSIASLHDLEPARFVMPALLFALPLATHGILALVDSQRRLGVRVASLALAAVVLLPFAWSPRAVVSRDFLLGQVRTEPSPHLPWLQATLVRVTDPSARVLYEDGIIGVEAPFGGYVAPVLQAACGAEFVGLSYPMAPMPHADVRFVNGRLLGQPITAMSEAEIERVLDLYNVGWIVAWTDASKEVFAAPGLGLREVGSRAHLVVYARKSRGFLLHGSGRARAEMNRIVVDVDAPGEVVVSYHWLRSLVLTPAGPLRRHDAAPDPIGMIAFDAPQAGRFVIENRYR